MYTDDSILAGPDEGELDEIVKLIHASPLKITEECDIEDFLGVRYVSPYSTAADRTNPE